MAFKLWCVFVALSGVALGVYGDYAGDTFASLVGILLVIVGVVRAASDPSIPRQWE